MPVFLKGADKSANSHIILRVCLGSIISSIKKDSADLTGDLNLFNLVDILLIIMVIFNYLNPLIHLQPVPAIPIHHYLNHQELPIH